MYINTHMHTYIYMHTHIYKHTYIYIYMYTHIYRGAFDTYSILNLSKELQYVHVFMHSSQFSTYNRFFILCAA
ncbi:hypothetical protein HanIR_Chr11g0506251 [Helianthus annuus]|nr:hypothetical protein HanIR_Chr11g0506251 [Helianthus annuus]